MLDLGIGAAELAALHVSNVEDEQVPLVCGYIYYVETDFCFRMPDLR